jgi:hypothetical protein
MALLDYLQANLHSAKPGSVSQKKFRNRSPAKFFQSTPQPLHRIFQADLDCISRPLTPENEKFCRINTHFVG